MIPKKMDLPKAISSPAGSHKVKRVPTLQDLREEIKMDDHMISMEELLQRLGTNCITGLSSSEAADRLSKQGPNCLVPSHKVAFPVKFMREMFSGFGPIMLAGALLSLIVHFIGAQSKPDWSYDNVYVATVLSSVLFITTSFSCYQKFRSEQIMDSFKAMLPEKAKVLRSGIWMHVGAEELVVGDIVEICGGDRIPADIRIISSNSFKVDNSSLTGESEPQVRNVHWSKDPLETRNLCFYTTNAIEGRCEAVVIRTGDRTVMGRIAKLTANMGNQPTPIGLEIAHCVSIICVIALSMGSIYVLAAYLLKVEWISIISLSIGLMVGNMPGGLLIMVTLMLALAAKRMAARNCLIKNLEAVESLGSCSVICTDKTGTLTQNQMTVSHVWVDDAVHDFVPQQNMKDLLFANSSHSTSDLLRIAGLCNRAKFHHDQESKPVLSRKVDGDASESALLKFVELTSGNAALWRKMHPVVAEIPFNSTSKFQLSIHELSDADQYILVMKGAPEVVLEHCSTILINGMELNLSLEWREKIHKACLALGNLGERVIAFCDYRLPTDKFPVPYPFDIDAVNFPVHGLRFVGLVSMIDPPRAAVPDAIMKCRSAGVRVVMVTGDHPVTALAIARSVGIVSEDSSTAEELTVIESHHLGVMNQAYCRAAVVRGDQLKDMTDSQLEMTLTMFPEIVFARTSPHQKLRIVEAFHRLGAVVAVTGDGVNDSPALKKADIGVAMGITGSDVSKQAADMVLLDDNFASIVSGIEEGRLIFDNIKKTCCYAMTTDIPEIAPVIVYLLLGLPLGLYTISMLLLNCATDLLPAVSLAYESAESDIMRRPPRSRKERLISSNLVQAVYLQIGIIESVGAFLVYFVIFGSYGWWPTRLFWLREQWETHVDDLQDSYGQEWTYARRKLLESTVNSGFFLATVAQNIIHLLVRRCRRKSLIDKGLRNYCVLFAIFFETALACSFVYIPGLQTVLQFQSISALMVLPVLPFLLYIFCYDEMRRCLIQMFPSSWIERNLYV